ncbi:MAG: N-6 DNA methylase [Bacteroidetes bacterium]|nr:N-6 DNA methylase [Bacteroidota bacterium]
MFPRGEDNTTIINGTIFVNEKGEANTTHANLFGQLLEFLDDFEKEHGSFKWIDRNFKTRLYESFLRQSAGIERLGQFFTPRNVVQAMVRMVDNNKLHSQSRVCDPFCGVGGFLLELIAEKPEIYRQFNPSGGHITPSTTLVGYDRGSDEQEDERTIILAKSNMLIYFSDLISEWHTPDFLTEFSQRVLNQVFRLLRTDTGTFGHIDDEAYDLILTNPPYVTSGSAALKDALKKSGKESFYAECGGKGTESLAISWIVKNLKPGGQALIVVPDGLLQQPSVLRFIKENCIIEGIISLPEKTFYATIKPTYILGFHRKNDTRQRQETPVFTYLITEIGESRDSRRDDIPENDLPEMVELYRTFTNVSTSACEKRHSPKCKVISFDQFDALTHWKISSLWTAQEKEDLGVIPVSVTLKPLDYRNHLNNINKELTTKVNEINSAIDQLNRLESLKARDFRLDDELYFQFLSGINTGWKVSEYKQWDTRDSSDIPIYSVPSEPVGHIKNTYPPPKID